MTTFIIRALVYTVSVKSHVILFFVWPTKVFNITNVLTCCIRNFEKFSWSVSGPPPTTLIHSISQLYSSMSNVFQSYTLGNVSAVDIYNNTEYIFYSV